MDFGCHPGVLEVAGYSFEEMEVLDIFPETHHVEVVAAFSR